MKRCLYELEETMGDRAANWALFTNNNDDLENDSDYVDEDDNLEEDNVEAQQVQCREGQGSGWRPSG